MENNYDDNKNLGWIKLFRSFKQWEWYSDVNARIVFIECLLTANHKDKRYKGILIKKGSFVTSYDTLSKEVGISIQQLRTSLDKLKSTHELTVKTSRQGTVIEIVNYEKYQQSTHEPTVNQQQDNSKITVNQQLTINKEIKNEKNERTLPGESEIEENNFFNKFWDIYPKKSKKQEALNLFNKYGEITQNKIIERVEELVKIISKLNKEDYPTAIRYLKNPYSYLSDESFNYDQNDLIHVNKVIDKTNNSKQYQNPEISINKYTNEESRRIFGQFGGTKK